MQKNKNQEHATEERICKEYHESRERMIGELEALEQDKRQYEWQLLIHNSKRQRFDQSDPTTEAMQQCINNIDKRLKCKKSEVENLDEEMNKFVKHHRRATTLLSS